MINLSDQIGLPISLKENFRLEIGESVEPEEFNVRKFSDLSVVAMEEGLSLSDDSAYLMYRGTKDTNHEQKIMGEGLRFDITIIPPASLGSEFIKTSGHYHPKKPGTDMTYPELYLVVAGQATYFMQKVDSEGRIVDAVVCRVKPGDVALMPPGYGHVTINELSEPLVMANWVASDFSSIYGDYEDKRGGAYYFLNKDGKSEVVENERYDDSAPLRELSSNPVLISDLVGAPVYGGYINNLDRLSFLTYPENFLSELKIENLYS